MINPVSKNYYQYFTVPTAQPVDDQNREGGIQPGGNSVPGVAEAPKAQQIGPKECKT